jgi:hypothetical protein
VAQETPVLLRTSERSTYRRCRQRWYWKYVDRLSNPRPKGALTFGTGAHLSLELRYPPGKKRGPVPTRFFLEWLGENHDYFSQWDDEGNKIPAPELAQAMMDGYVAEYGNDEEFEIIRPEQTFAIDVYDRKGNYLVTYVGKVDAVARRRSTGSLVLLEHKTAKSLEDIALISGYGEQGLSYLWAAVQMLRHDGLIGEDEIINEVLYNILVKRLPDTRPANEAGLKLNQPSKDALVAACDEYGIPTKGRMNIKGLKAALIEEGGWTEDDVAQLGEVSKNQPGKLFDRQPMYVQPHALARFEERLRKEAWEMRQVRNGKIPVYKNPTKDCRWDCEFREMCELHEMGGDWQEFRDIELVQWDPYNDHEYLEEKS